MKGIILAGGAGTRLHPLTISVSKQLLPVYNKPMIWYPLSTMMLSGIEDILMITTPQDQPAFQKLLGDGSDMGINLEYAIQPEPKGLAQAFTIGKQFIDDNGAGLILGDNLYHASGLSKILQGCVQSIENNTGAMIFAYQVKDPERYGVVEFNKEGKALSIEEKPEKPKSRFAVPGLYFYDNNVVEIAKNLAPSKRGEFEITDINKTYLEAGKLQVQELNRGTAWLDTGTFEALQQAGEYVKTIEERQGQQVGNPYEVAFRMGLIDCSQLESIANTFEKNHHRPYLLELSKEGR